MSDVWPPPPKNQPAPEQPQETSSGMSAVVCVSGGALLLALVMFAFTHKPLFELDYSYAALAVVGGATLIGLMLLHLGGWLAGRAKGTKSGRAASALCIIVNIAFMLLTFLYNMYGQ